MMPTINLHTFTDLPSASLKSFVRGQGRLEATGQTLRFVNGSTTTSQYSNAQIDDYQGLARRNFVWRPPVHLQVTARFSHSAGSLAGTAGFGFWNDPFLMTGTRWPTLPKALWFFYSSPPSNMKLDLQTPGWGWKAATIDAWRWSFLALAPLAPLAIPLMHIPALYQRCWPVGQQAITVSEQAIESEMTAWHTYSLKWHKNYVHFEIDGQPLLHCTTVPRGPLGLVIWFDNQYMVVTPWGQFKYGLVAQAEAQWMEIDQLTVTAF